MRCNLVILLFVALGACTTASEDYPSLAVRDAERVTGTLEPVAPAAPYVPPATPADVIDRLAQLTAQAASAHGAFTAEAPVARSLVATARGAGPGDDAWARAQVAVAGLEATRSRAMIALADLDRLYVDAAVGGAAIDRIGAARETVSAQVNEQDRTIESLLGALR